MLHSWADKDTIDLSSATKWGSYRYDKVGLLLKSEMIILNIYTEEHLFYYQKHWNTNTKTTRLRYRYDKVYPACSATQTSNAIYDKARLKSINRLKKKNVTNTEWRNRLKITLWY